VLRIVAGGVPVSDPRRQVPRTDAVMADPRLAGALARLGRTAVKHAVTATQERARRGDIAPQDVVAAAVAALPDVASGLRPVINATGVVLHTNLGRAALSGAAVSAILAAAGYTEGASVELRGFRLHIGGVGGRLGHPGRTGGRRHRLRAVDTRPVAP